MESSSEPYMRLQYTRSFAATWVGLILGYSSNFGSHAAYSKVRYHWFNCTESVQKTVDK